MLADVLVGAVSREVPALVDLVERVGGILDRSAAIFWGKDKQDRRIDGRWLGVLGFVARGMLSVAASQPSRLLFFNVRDLGRSRHARIDAFAIRMGDQPVGIRRTTRWGSSCIST